MRGACRRMRAASLALCALACLWGPRAGTAAQGSSGSAESMGPRFAFHCIGLPDTLLRSEPMAAGTLERLWDRAELEALAGRLRERLAGLSRYDATLRLVLVPGAGTSPGTAMMTLVTASAPGVFPRRAVAVMAQGSDFPGAQRSFLRGSGGSASPEAIAAGIAAIRDDAVAAGRYAAVVAVDSLVPMEGEVRVHLRVAAGPPAAFEALELPGATATRPSAAAAIAGLKRGRTVTPSTLADAKERLVGSELFDIVGEPRVLAGREPGRARVVIPVEESHSSHFEGALGVAQGGGVTGLIDLGLGNIAGSGRTAGARWQGQGGGLSTYALRYREPALFGKPIDAALSLDADVADSLYTQTRWALAFGGRPLPRARGSLALARSGSVYSGFGRGSSGTWSVLGSLEWQALTPRPNPVRGFAAAIQLEGGRRTERYPGYPGIRRGLARGKVSLASATPLGGARVLHASARAEETSLGGGEFPVEELRYLGGGDGLRGHRDRAFAGNRIAALNLEHRWLTDPRGGRAYLFFDAARHALDVPVAAGTDAGAGGSAALARTQLSDGWEMGYGVGLQAPVASGLAGVELGIRPGAALREATVHLRYASRW